MSLTVSFVASERDIPTELWAACFPPPLEGRWWYHALESAGLEDQFEFFYALVMQDGVAVGIAPAFVMDVDIVMVVPKEVLPLFTIPGKLFPSLLYQRTLFVGSPCSDEGTVGLLDGVDRRAALAVLQQAFEAQGRARRATVLAWKDFPAAWGDDFAWLRQRSRLFRLTSFPGTEVDLCGSKDGYYASLKSSRRHSMKKKIKRSQAQAVLAAEVVQNPPPELLEEIFTLFWQTYQRAETRFEVLNLRFFALLAALPQSHFMLLRDGERLVAFMLCFAQGDHVINKFIGLDYTRPKEWALYFRLWDEVVGWAAERGASVIQSGQTGYSAKVEMGHRLVPLTNYCQHRNPLIHWVYAKVAATVGWRTLDHDLAVFLKAHPELAPSSSES